jgi:hypothetical protein
MAEHAPTGRRATRAANLFDLRRIIGGLFVAWGVLLTVLGLFDSAAEVEEVRGACGAAAGRCVLSHGRLLPEDDGQDGGAGQGAEPEQLG